MSDNVVDIRKLVDMDKRVAGFLNSIKALAAVIEPLGTTLSYMGQADQRLLAQIMAWRMEGGPYLPATEGLIHMPLLVGMGFASIAAAAERLVDGEVIVNVPLKTDPKNGNVLETGFRWPALEQLLAQGAHIAAGPQLTAADGVTPLKPV
jgi:hypothetical protein